MIPYDQFYTFLIDVLMYSFLTLAASEIQMMALPHAQYVIAESSTPVSGGNSNQVKTVSDGA